jgi:hypothetical protein
VHVVGPEQGLSQPGMIIVCGDSHTATHGAVGCLAFGVGASEVSHVLATQTLWQSKPKNMRIVIDGILAPGVHAKDAILAIIARIGTAGGTGHVIEYAGSTIRALGIEGRLTICNMSIEAGARARMVAPDDTTFAYLHGRPYAPKGADWDKAFAYWRSLPSDTDAQFDREVRLDAAREPLPLEAHEFAIISRRGRRSARYGGVPMAATVEPITQAGFRLQSDVANEPRAAAPSFEDDLAVVVGFEFRTVANADQRRLGRLLGQSLHQPVLAFRVERSSRLVEHDDIRVVEEDAGEG